MARQTNPKLLADFFNKIGPFLPFTVTHHSTAVGSSGCQLFQPQPSCPCGSPIMSAQPARCAQYSQARQVSADVG